MNLNMDLPKKRKLSKSEKKENKEKNKENKKNKKKKKNEQKKKNDEKNKENKGKKKASKVKKKESNHKKIEKQPQVNFQKINNQVKQFNEEQFYEREFLLSHTHNKSLRRELFDDQTFENYTLNKSFRQHKYYGQTKDIYTTHAKQRVQERGIIGPKIRDLHNPHVIITVLPEDRIKQRERLAKEQEQLRRFLAINNNPNL